ncbi:MAG: ATP-binding protein, partial [Verrucomicrobiales bacterium]
HPLIRDHTRPMRRRTPATEETAEGNFDTPVDAARRDELGRLGSAIEAMAKRLEGFVTGQRRFLGDIAHELCSPIARLQVALGILEQRLGTEGEKQLADLREEVDQMSGMVEELLLFSKSSLGAQHLELEEIAIEEIVREAISREGGGEVEIVTTLGQGLVVLADRRFLMRAVANLVRNAVAYAGHAGPVVVSAARRGEDRIEITVTDCGPGIPAEAAQEIFDPFFRPESSRTRETGGVGLGLAIVKSCVEACGGTVSCRNREPNGFEVTLDLRVG